MCNKVIRNQWNNIQASVLFSCETRGLNSKMLQDSTKQENIVFQNVYLINHLYCCLTGILLSI